MTSSAVAPFSWVPNKNRAVPIVLGPGVFPWAGPDGATSSAQFQVTDVFTVSKVTLTLTNFRHTFAGDVSLWLSAPTGGSARLVAGACDGAWFGGAPVPNISMAGALYTWDDAASNKRTLRAFCNATMPARAAGPSIAAGTYMPETPLSVLAGNASAGLWTFTYGDAAVGGARPPLEPRVLRWVAADSTPAQMSGSSTVRC